MALDELDALVVGAGFAGVYALHRLRGLGLRTRVFEAGDDAGGTWYWNRYPGARCDSESLYYSYSFSDELQQEWDWTERYPSQPEILSYVRHVVERFDLRREISFGRRVTSARYDEAGRRWQVRASSGEEVSARFLIMATGCLSAPRVPDFPGLESFRGELLRTFAWPGQEVDFGGRRVGVIGTGSTGIQCIPLIAEQADHLVVFQRTPNFCVPARNHPLDPAFLAEFKSAYPDHRRRQRESHAGTASSTPNDVSALAVSRVEREREYEARWQAGGAGFLGAFNDLMTNLEANETAAEFVRGKIREAVSDPDVAELLIARDHPFGTKRLCVGTGYYETYNRDNVTLVDLRRDPLESVTARGVRTVDRFFEIDSLVLATGFDAMTGALLRVDIRGRGGRALADCWAAGPRTYLGLAVAGFPNLFTVTGPGSPSVLSNVVHSIEQHVEWITRCIGDLEARGLTSIEAEEEAQESWVAHVNELSETTLYKHANSWYLGANIPGKPRVFMPYVGGVPAYARTCEEVAANGYQGFRSA